LVLLKFPHCRIYISGCTFSGLETCHHR
jgi:hypothetical protein